MMTILRLGLKGKVRDILEGCVVPQSEFDCTAVHTGAQAIDICEAVEPSNTTEELALNSELQRLVIWMEATNHGYQTIFLAL